MTKLFKTDEGLELPLLNLKGKDYLQVPHRVQWFRSKHPNWTILTEYVALGDDFAFAKATILDENKNPIATSHKYEDLKGFADFREKAETGAIGRALALCGFGTQFATELEEGTERIVDSPQPQRVKSPTIPAEKHPFISASQQALIDVILDHGYQEKDEISGILMKLVKKSKTRDLDEREIQIVRQWFMNNPKPIFT